MPVVSMVFGVLLVALGLYGRFGTEHGAESLTSLIPAGFGALLLLLGALALKESLLKHAMHGAAMVGLLGFLSGLVPPFMQFRKTGGLDITQASAASGLLLSLVSLVFVGLCVNSFVQVRRRRAREAGPPPM